MIRNYLIIALRNIVRHKLYSFINIVGLAVGLSCVTFIILFVRDEMSYDKWLPGTQNLYQLELTLLAPGRPPQDFATVPYPMPAAMHDQIPEVTGFTRLSSEQMTITASGRQFVETAEVVEPNFFQIITLPFVLGDRARALMQPESVVLSQSMAKKYFGNADPIGKLITVSKPGCAVTDEICRAGTLSLVVTGVFRDLPHNSQLTADIIFPNTSSADRIGQTDKQEWLENNEYGYVVLAPGTDPQTVLEKLDPILDRSLGEKLRQAHIAEKGSQVYKVHLTPFQQVHLSSSRFSSNLTPAGSWTTIFGVIAIGFLIMLVACFNFMNLATARATLRSREIALRKTLGARRGQVVFQFLGESVLMALFALALALAMAEILLPAFDGFLQRPITLQYLPEWPILFLLTVIAITAGLVGGSYPAFILSGFQPALVLRANASGQVGSGRLRAILVVIQFAVSIGLGIAALVVFSQISFARNIDLGFRRDNVIIVNAGNLTPSARDNFTQLLRSHPGVLETALSNDVAFTNNQSLDIAQVPGQSDNVLLNQLVLSPSFTRLYDISVVAGRMLSENRAQDQLAQGFELSNEGHNILINEAAATRLGFTPQQAVGKTILLNNSHVHIVGVLSNFKFRGAREPVRPTVYFNNKRSTSLVSIRVRPDDLSDTLAFIDKAWHSFSAHTSSQRYFLQDSFNRLYRVDERQGAMFCIFVGIAIVIACLGLFGLAAFTASQRTKEIGIRKVFGARISDVVLYLLWQFSIPVLGANAIAWPISWYYLHSWLEGFAYRIALSPLYFAGAAIVALFIAWATVLVHALRVASANPVHALRYE